MLYPLSYEGIDCLLHSCSNFSVERNCGSVLRWIEPYLAFW
jgi:hypothetical protein